MWLGIVATVLVVLFPPGETGLIFFREAYNHEIYFVALSALIFCVALVTVALVYTLRDKKPPNEQ